MKALILQRKYSLHGEHQARLLSSPRPAWARGRFERRLRQAQRVSRVRGILWIVLSLGAITAVASLVLNQVRALQPLGEFLAVLAGLGSSFSVLCLAGVFLCRRFLDLVDVELSFYAAEARMPVREREPTVSAAQVQLARKRI